MKKLSGVIVGAGNFGYNILQRFYGTYGMDLSKEIEHIWLIDIDEKMLLDKGNKFKIPSERRLKDKSSLEDKMDFAMIATPAAVHLETTMPWLTERIPTFLAKPLDASYANARKLTELAEQYRVLNASGSQMLLHPAFIKAMHYIKENKIKITQVHINWNKERGPRDHPMAGIAEEAAHPFGVLSVLKPEGPARVFADERKGEIIIDLKKWEKYDAKASICCKGHTKFQDSEYVLGEISKTATAMLVYSDSTTATVRTDFEDPLKQRTVHIVGELPEGERFQRSIAIYVDLTSVRPQDREHASYIRNGIRVIQGCTDERSGMGHIVLDEEVKGADDFGAQLKAFLDYVRTGEKPEALMNFSDESRAEELVEAMMRSIKENKEIRYIDGEYV